jgi:hypothetical protein
MEKMQDGVLHFKWTDRGTGRVEDDRMVFPGVIEFKKVKTGRENDRVFILKYTGSSERFMFWMQDKSDEKDADNCSKINEYANNPAALDAAVAAQQAESANATGGGRAGADAWMQMMGLGGMGGAAGGPSGGEMPDMSALAGMGGLGAGSAASPSASSLPEPVASTEPAATTGAAAAAAAAATSAEPNPFGNLDLSSLLGQLGTAPGNIPPAAPGAASLGGVPALRQRPVTLQDVVTPDGVLNSGVLEDAEIRARLIAQLPDGAQNEEELQSTLTSPQFRQGLAALSEALYSDNFSSIMANLGIDPQPGMPALVEGNNVRALLLALQAQFPPSEGGGTSSTGNSGGDQGGDASGGGAMEE